MSGLLRSSIGKKVIVSLSGLFLIVFLCVHLTVNLLTLAGPDTFNEAAHFMGHSPMMKIMEPVLALGFLFHMLYSVIVTLQNKRARPIGYKKSGNSQNTSWPSRNMIYLGLIIFVFLIVHIINYFYKIKFTDMLVNGQEISEYDLVIGIFKVEYWYYIALYIVGFIMLGLHLNHAFQSAFQTLGLNNKHWERRLKVVGSLYALVIAVGFTIIPLFFLFKNGF